ncbi:uncharacterized protein OCT59_002579 [Rhizophagus irregularis]|uniref:Uncharacterized protein n=1 Tax=Rhizophagus irregularis (strain DAOM 197198w) TaxID=1432141 RepID=A0A015MAB4_RHIIW|nr:hypothetical protein RirG_149170 [Rhizophagus irregularis DAOM 197198w]PKY35588.1 hypothetical protein RhiirB3_456606 [Rhizophagus irregularis]UZO11002.1 hypothetical protein OCT59_002579 [Rhizophagus irregularis]GBC13607.1 hypothetical protein GLOIN_2v1786063 [Rhizophagus irregularis DAOM 181602=DAOM 197198]CAG8744510.1 1716_t:CDS:1 [Rhizophagus irregularis]
MGGKYICQYPSNEGIVCGNGNTRPEGCSIHWKRHQRPLCKQDGCVRPIASKYGYCNLHVNKSYSKANYHRKKLAKMLQNGQTPEALGQALDKMKKPNAISWP